MRRVYFLPLTGMEDGPCLERAWEKVDSARQEKALRCRNHQDKLRSVAAGLLLQYITAGRKTADVSRTEEDTSVIQESTVWTVLTLEKVMERIGNPKELPVKYGMYGKPYFTEEYSDMFFSLSHSGSWVVCGVSFQEIGADIQEISAKDNKKLAHRFFTQEECRALEASGQGQERDEFFYRLWARKEAYGKLKGDGLVSGMRANTIGKDRKDSVISRTTMSTSQKDRLIWEDYLGLNGYAVSICYYK